jgi:hypothetical protein
MINIPENEEESFVAKLIEITESKIYFIDWYYRVSIDVVILR